MLSFYIDHTREGLDDKEIQELLDMSVDRGAVPLESVAGMGCNGLSRHTYEAEIDPIRYRYVGVNLIGKTHFDVDITAYGGAHGLLLTYKEALKFLERKSGVVHYEESPVEENVILKKEHKDWCQWKNNPSLGAEDVFCDCPACW